MIFPQQHDPYRKSWLAMWIKQEYKTILDVSAGGGRFADFYKWLGLSVTCTEHDPDKVEALKHAGYPTKLCDLDKQKLPFKANSFDVVVSTEVAEHLRKPKVLVSEMMRVAKSLVLLTTPVGDSFKSPDHIQKFANEKELVDKAIGKIDCASCIAQFITKPGDIGRQASFGVAIMLDEPKL